MERRETQRQQGFTIEVVVNYWEVRPSRMNDWLEDLKSEGIFRVASFLPWQAFESDISHSFQRFLEAIELSRMELDLIVTPEVGVHFPNSGLPKDLAQNRNVRAVDEKGMPFPVHMPPSGFCLPSPFSEDFRKRYYGFLSRFHVFFNDTLRAHPRLRDQVTLHLTGSYWKYFRSAYSAAYAPFGSEVGDASKSMGTEFRRSLDDRYSDQEYQVPNAAAANRWKNRLHEPINRKWFLQESEDVFRLRSLQSVCKNGLGAATHSIEMFTPEADPSNTYSSLLQRLVGGFGDFYRLSSLLESYSGRTGYAGEEECAPFIHWSGLGAFRSLSDAEKQFLLLKSVLLCAGKGGRVLLSETEWKELSPSFRSRVDLLTRLMADGDYRLETGVVLLTHHLWSSVGGTGGGLWEHLDRLAGLSLRVTSSLDSLLEDQEARLVVVDPQMILTKDMVVRLRRWLAKGRILALPRNHFSTEAGQKEIQRLAKKSVKPISVRLGIPYEIHDLGSEEGAGSLVLYEAPDWLTTDGEIDQAWKTFSESMVSLAEIKEGCRFSDDRLASIELRSLTEGKRGLFVLNPTTRAIEADLLFSEPVMIGELGGETEPAPADRFHLNVPPCGVLPMSVESRIESRKSERPKKPVVPSSEIGAP